MSLGVKSIRETVRDSVVVIRACWHHVGIIGIEPQINAGTQRILTPATGGIVVEPLGGKRVEENTIDGNAKWLRDRIT
jgi:hypothetical protein